MTDYDGAFTSPHSPDEPLPEALEVLRELAGVVPVWELSWGQRKAAAVLTALSSKPDILLADELLEGLSPKLASRVLEVVERAVETIVLTSHRLYNGWRVYFMEEGVSLPRRSRLKQTQGIWVPRLNRLISRRYQCRVLPSTQRCP